MTGPAVELKDVSKLFGDFKAVDNISLAVDKGEIFGFLGPNGAGKSTTIRMLCGLLAPTSGSGMVAGLDITKDSEKIKSSIGYMSQKFSLYDDLKVIENLNFFGGIYGLDGRMRKKRIEETLAQIELTDRTNHMTRDLPVGHKQRLALGCAILHEPQIIFLDEPTSGVDPKTRRNFWDQIYELASKGITLFVTTHFMEEAEYCDRIALIDNGKMIATGSPDQLKNEHLDGVMFDLVSSDSLAAVEILALGEKVKEASIFGRSVHVLMDEATDAEKYMEALLAPEGLKIETVRPIEPTLEDVFVALVGRTAEETL